MHHSDFKTLDRVRSKFCITTTYPGSLFSARRTIGWETANCTLDAKAARSSTHKDETVNKPAACATAPSATCFVTSSASFPIAKPIANASKNTLTRQTRAQPSRTKSNSFVETESAIVAASERSRAAIIAHLMQPSTRPRPSGVEVDEKKNTARVQTTADAEPADKTSNDSPGSRAPYFWTGLEGHASRRDKSLG